MRVNLRIKDFAGMRTTLELPDPLFAPFKARAAIELVSLKQLLRTFVEQGLASDPAASRLPRSAKDLPSWPATLWSRWRVAVALSLPPQDSPLTLQGFPRSSHWHSHRTA